MSKVSCSFRLAVFARLGQTQKFKIDVADHDGEFVLLLSGEVTVPLRKLCDSGNSGRTTKL